MKKNCKGWNQHQNGIFLFCRVKPSGVDNLFIRLNGKTWLEAKNWLTLSSWRHRRINAFSKLYNSQHLWHWALPFFSGDTFNDDGWCYSIFLETSAHLCLFKLPNYTSSESSGSGTYIYWISPWDTFIDEYSSYFGIRIGIMNRANLALLLSWQSAGRTGKSLWQNIEQCDAIFLEKTNICYYCS